MRGSEWLDEVPSPMVRFLSSAGHVGAGTSSPEGVLPAVLENGEDRQHGSERRAGQSPHTAVDVPVQGRSSPTGPPWGLAQEFWASFSGPCHAAAYLRLSCNRRWSLGDAASIVGTTNVDEVAVPDSSVDSRQSQTREVRFNNPWVARNTRLISGVHRVGQQRSSSPGLSRYQPGFY